MRILITTAILLLLCGCKPDGSQIGDQKNLPANTTNASSYNVLEAACVKVVPCHTSTIKDCLVSSFALQTFGIKLGLPVQDQNLYLQDIIDREEKGEFIADPAAAQTCEAEMANLTCGDAVVINAFSGSLMNRYEHLPEMLPASCAHVFQ